MTDGEEVEEADVRMREKREEEQMSADKMNVSRVEADGREG